MPPGIDARGLRVEPQVTTENGFLRDVLAMREDARVTLSRRPKGARTMQAEQAIALLQTALAIEIVCVWRYTMISVSVAGLADEEVGTEFQEQANDERRHMRVLAERITELGGTPDFAADRLTSRAGMEYGSAADLASMVAQNLAAEQSAIQHYRELIPHFVDTDPQTCRILESILQDEENHADDMQDLLDTRR
jgi:bacterioferritin